MKIEILDVNYDSSPSEIIASLRMDAGEQFSNDSVFATADCQGSWKIHEFARDAPAAPSEEPANCIVVLAEIGDCERLSVGAELLPKAEKNSSTTSTN